MPFIKKLIVLALVLNGSAAVAANSPLATVAFVGCRSDGQAGPKAAPRLPNSMPKVAKALAPRLAYYEAAPGTGVLGPPGWYCFNYYGSNGAFLLVSQDPAIAKDARPGNIPALAGPAIQLNFINGWTSGRFEVARVAARLFPAYRALVQSAVAEGIEPASDFPFGPYPNDHLSRRSSNDVIFVTPAGHDGMGTASRLIKNNEPITGEAVIGKSALILIVRLPAGLKVLEPDIFDEMRKSLPNLN